MVCLSIYHECGLNIAIFGIYSVNYTINWGIIGGGTAVAELICPKLGYIWLILMIYPSICPKFMLFLMIFAINWGIFSPPIVITTRQWLVFHVQWLVFRIDNSNYY